MGEATDEVNEFEDSGTSFKRRSLLESAHRGTVFMDEIADLSLAAQAKILRLAAAEGRFREDLGTLSEQRARLNPQN